MEEDPACVSYAVTDNGQILHEWVSPDDRKTDKNRVTFFFKWENSANFET